MQQIGEGFGSHVQPHDRSRKILRCLLSWVRIDKIIFDAFCCLNWEMTSHLATSGFLDVPKEGRSLWLSSIGLTDVPLTL